MLRRATGQSRLRLAGMIATGVAVLFAGAIYLWPTPLHSQMAKKGMMEKQKMMMMKMGQQVGGFAYTMSHAMVQNPPEILGGALKVTLTQNNGGARWVYPGPRALDPVIFGTPAKPLGYEPAPFPLVGVPTKMRGTKGGAYTMTMEPTPFSDKWGATSGSVSMVLVDKTATDGAKTQDTVDFTATFKAPKTNTEYKVVVKKALPHGFAFPFFGGVATNLLLHGFTGIGSRLMPTEFVYAAFWGVGNIYRDGKLVNERQLVHAMITEPLRGDGYKLAMDHQVPAANPNIKTLHLMVPPYQLTMAMPPLKKVPVKTGLMLKTPMGQMQQPFFHVMFSNFKLSTSHE